LRALREGYCFIINMEVERDETLEEFLRTQREIKTTRINQRIKKKRLWEKESSNRPYVGPGQPHRSRKIGRNSTPGPGEYDEGSNYCVEKKTCKLGKFNRAPRPCNIQVEQFDERPYINYEYKKQNKIAKFGGIKRAPFFQKAIDPSLPGPGSYDYQDSTPSMGFFSPQKIRGLENPIQKSHRPAPGTYDPYPEDQTTRTAKFGRMPVSPRFDYIPISPH